MSKIDLNSSEYDGSIIFNGGTAGVVENVKVEVSKKTAEDADNYPDFRLRFVSQNGAGIDKGFYYLDENAENFARRLIGLGSELKHIWGVVLGADVKLPEFDTHKEMLEGVFGKFNEAIASSPDNLYRITVDYGTNDRPQQYLRIQYYPPYIESMEVRKEESRLGLRNNARVTAFVPDNKDETYDGVHTKPADAGAWK